MAQPVTALLDGRDPEIQFIHEDDLVRLIATCVEKRAAGVYNAVGEGTITSTEAARMSGKRTVKLPYRAVWGIVWALHRTRALDFSMPPGILDFFRNTWVASGDKAKRELERVEEERVPVSPGGLRRCGQAGRAKDYDEGECGDNARPDDPFRSSGSRAFYGSRHFCSRDMNVGDLQRVTRQCDYEFVAQCFI